MFDTSASSFSRYALMLAFASFFHAPPSASNKAQVTP
ncbi:hypothetical protein 1013_scaffold1877_00002 [Bacteriophage sp.]|nr:hypothetical protein 1013_scaffold1877_00002 [Bacteriophage sp.]